MIRAACGLLLAWLVAIAPVLADEKQCDGLALDKSDPLFQALQQLQRDVEQLRGELRGAASRSRGASSMKSAAGMNVSPKPARTPVSSASKSALPLPPAKSIESSKSDHWSFQRVLSPPLPTVRDEKWIRDDLDRFILAKLDKAAIQPSSDASRYTLLRRIAFDLTGLPPTEQEIKGFVDDPAPLDQALARVVDGYLNSPRFGERWGRHWLDTVRYADSVGRNWNSPFTYAWRYRDYVIDSLNSDKSYDRFLTEQLAGDLLPADSLDSRREQLTATGFLALGAMDIIVPEGESLMMDRVDEQIDVTTRAMLGLTVACARCHDHKYEPVTMRDYYALAGVFYSTETKSGQRRGNYVADDDLIMLPAADGNTQPIPGVHSMADMNREQHSGGYREVLWTTDPNLAMAAVEGRVQDCPIRMDGEAWKRGSAPARGDFRIAGLSGLKGIDSDASGRLELARWISSSDNPLTARVMVNRIWQHLFGRGLVDTVDNFGQSGNSPTHPLLLDHLATRFGKVWSLKSMIRSILLSRSYRLSSAGSPERMRVDAANELYWRMNPRRIEMEAVRDSMLSVSGRLKLQRPEGIQIAGRGGKGRWGETRSLLSINSGYRTVYLPVLRSLLPEMYSTFDFPNPTQVKGQREVTTVATQALFLMNSDFAAGVSRDAADRVLNENHSNDTQRIRTVYLRMVGRLPDDSEINAAVNLMDSLAESSELSRWSTLIQGLMISGEFRTLL